MASSGQRQGILLNLLQCTGQPPPQQQHSTQPQITAARLRKPALMEYANAYSVATTGDSDSDSDGNPEGRNDKPPGSRGLLEKDWNKRCLIHTELINE